MAKYSYPALWYKKDGVTLKKQYRGAPAAKYRAEHPMLKASSAKLASPKPVLKKKACKHRVEGYTREQCNKLGHRAQCGRCCGKKLKPRKPKAEKKPKAAKKPKAKAVKK